MEGGEDIEVSEEELGKGKLNDNAHLPQTLPPSPTHRLSSSPCKTPGQFIDNDDRYMPD